MSCSLSLPNYSVLDYQQDSLTLNLTRLWESVIGSSGHYHTPHKILITETSETFVRYRTAFDRYSFRWIDLAASVSTMNVIFRVFNRVAGRWRLPISALQVFF